MTLQRIQKQMLDTSVQNELNKIGDTSTLSTTQKGNLVGAVNELSTQLADIAKKISDSIFMKDYGIKSIEEDSTFDCLPALIQAINDANERGGYVRIEFPDGKFKFGVASNIPEIVGFHIYFCGQGEEITKLYFTSGTYFIFGTDTGLKEGGGFNNLSIVYDTPDTTSPTVLTKAVSGVYYRNLKLYNVCTFLQCGTDTIKSYSQRLFSIRVAVANLGKPLIKLVNGAGFYWEDGSGGFVSGVNPPVGQEDMTTVQGTDFVLVEGNWDTLRLNNFIERFYRGVYLKADSGKTILNITINNSLYDYIRDKSIFVYANGGTIASVTINNCKFNSWENHCVHISSVGYCSGIKINNVDIPFSGGAGIQMDGNASKFNIINPTIRGCKRKITGNGIVVANGLKDFSIEGGDIGGDVSSAGITWGTTTGLSLLGNNDNYSVRGLKSYRFEITNPTTADSANASKKKQIKDNIWTGNEAGYNYAGTRSTGIFTLPSNNTSWYNTSPYDVEIHIHGGDVTYLQKEGLQLPNNASFTLRPGERFGINYNVAPNINFYARQ